MEETRLRMSLLSIINIQLEATHRALDMDKEEMHTVQLESGSDSGITHRTLLGAVRRSGQDQFSPEKRCPGR